MYWLKSCPKCKGDLFQEHDHYGTYIACVQCGHYLRSHEEAALRANARSIERRPVIAEAAAAMQMVRLA